MKVFVSGSLLFPDRTKTPWQSIQHSLATTASTAYHFIPNLYSDLSKKLFQESHSSSSHKNENDLSRRLLEHVELGTYHQHQGNEAELSTTTRDITGRNKPSPTRNQFHPNSYENSHESLRNEYLRRRERKNNNNNINRLIPEEMSVEPPKITYRRERFIDPRVTAFERSWFGNGWTLEDRVDIIFVLSFLVGIGVSIGTGGLLMFHMYLVCTNQTTIEVFEASVIKEKLG